MRPSEAILRLARGRAGHIARPGADVLNVTGNAVRLAERTVIAASIGHIDVVGIGSDPRALAQCNRMPRFGADSGPDLGARSFERAFILRRSENVERELVVHRDFIELSRRLIVLAAPVF